ncbi:zinc finger, BED-type [Artemisia annua]|uniref:Zinc finger, BED-type n=1 Tax=Artemisia annua TaxID=35608 RepID=A0A2U1PDL6_ARTAN|nr:zinc finger, BED-type [Artemisia annua]
MEAGNEDELVVNVDEPDPVIDVDEPMIDVDEPVIDVDEGNEQNEEVRNRKSFVWKHFTYKKGAMKHQCPYCKKWIASGTRKHGTSAMGNHLKKSCPTSPLFLKVIDKKKQSTLSFKPSTLGQSGGSTLVGVEQNSEKYPILSQVGLGDSLGNANTTLPRSRHLYRVGRRVFNPRKKRIIDESSHYAWEDAESECHDQEARGGQEGKEAS